MTASTTRHENLMLIAVAIAATIVMTIGAVDVAARESGDAGDASGTPGDASGDAEGGDAIAGIWEGRKVDGRYQTTEPWGPFLIERGADGSLSATFLGSRLGERDLAMYDVSLTGDRFHLKMSRVGGAVLDARLDPDSRLTGTLQHHGITDHGTGHGITGHGITDHGITDHGITEDLQLERIPNRTDRDIEALLESGKIARSPPYQSEWMSVLIHRGPEMARRIFEAVRAEHPERRLWGPSVVNRYGYELVNRNRTALAVEVFKLNALAHADDANSFDSLGEGYLRNGDRELAIEAFRRALALNPRPQVKDNSIKLLAELGIDVYRED